MWPSRESAIIYLTFLAAFFATTLNTLLGVESIDEAYFRAAQCLGSKPRHILFRVVLPGALSFYLYWVADQYGRCLVLAGLPEKCWP